MMGGPMVELPDRETIEMNHFLIDLICWENTLPHRGRHRVRVTRVYVLQSSQLAYRHNFAIPFR